MATPALYATMTRHLEELQKKGTMKGVEHVICGVKSGRDGLGPRYLLQGCGNREFLRMNSNSYLGLGEHNEVIAAEEKAARKYGSGPGAVRFISGTFQPHVELEERLASFHGREAAMIFSSAYSAVMGVLPPLITENTVVISDQLNHNSIINAIRLARPAAKLIYPHLDMDALEKQLEIAATLGNRVLVVSDGIFSMRGDHAPLDRMTSLCSRHEKNFSDGILTVMDDSHGVGAFGLTGRGTEEETGGLADLLVATLGKAIGINGGYVAGAKTIISYLRETSPFYIYSNPITPAEAAAAIKALDIIDSPEGLQLLQKVRQLTRKLEEGLVHLGHEIIAGPHPIVPLMIRDTEETSRLVDELFAAGILATGIKYPVVPRGDEEIRLQVNALHTEKDIDFLLSVLQGLKK